MKEGTPKQIKKRDKFQFLIGSMKEYTLLLMGMNLMVSIPYRFNERGLQLVFSVKNGSFNSI